MTRWSWHLGAAMAIVLCALVFVRCERRGSTSGEDDTTVVDTELLAFLSLARAHHHEADIKEQAGDAAGAIDALQHVVDGPKPHPGTTIPEVEEVLADAYARMAELRLTHGEADLAKRDVEAGLLHANGTTYFRGHLLEVYGIVEKERSAAFADAGSVEEATAARTHALELLRQAVDVQERVIGRVLDGSAGDGGK